MLRIFTLKIGPCLVLCLLCLCSSMAQPEGSWRTAIDRNNIEVKIYRSSDLKVRGFKAETTLYMPFDSVQKIFDNVERYPKWQATVKEAKKIYQRSEKSYHVFTKENLPFPAKNREFMWAVNKEWDERRQAMVYDLVCSSNTLPDKNDYGAIMQTFTSWWLEPVSEDEVKIIYYTTVDMGGKIPAWVISLLNPELPYKTLENLRAYSYSDGEVISALD